MGALLDINWSLVQTQYRPPSMSSPDLRKRGSGLSCCSQPGGRFLTSCLTKEAGFASMASPRMSADLCGRPEHRQSLPIQGSSQLPATRARPAPIRNCCAALLRSPA